MIAPASKETLALATIQPFTLKLLDVKLDYSIWKLENNVRLMYTVFEIFFAPGVKSVSILNGGECRLMVQAALQDAATKAWRGAQPAKQGYSRSVLSTWNRKNKQWRKSVLNLQKSWYPSSVLIYFWLRTWLTTVRSASPSGKLCAVSVNTRVAAASRRATAGSLLTSSLTPSRALVSLRRRSRRLMAARKES